MRFGPRFLLALALGHAPATNAQAPPPVGVPRFAIPASPIALAGSPRPGVYLAEVGRRAALFGDETGSFEVWAWPLKLVQDLHLAFKIPEYDAPIPAAQVAQQVIVRPEGQTIVYSHPTFTVRAHVHVPLDEPGAVILLEVESVRPLDILVQMRADFNLAWPGGFGGGNIYWDEERHSFVLSQGGVHHYSGFVGSPFATGGTSHPAHDAPTVPSQFTLRFDPGRTPREYIPIVMAGGPAPSDSVWSVYLRILANAPASWGAKAEHYRVLREESLSLRSPDPELDRALEWAKVNLDRQRVCNPDLGCGLVAGFGRAGSGNFRPGFGWYFGGDAAINSFAMDGLGQFDLVREGLAFLAKYQRADGKIAHEISHAAARLPWFEEYPYTFFHGDTTPFWLLACYEYWKASGDGAFLKQFWPNMVKAYRWSKATDLDGDGLMDNPKAGAGAIEVGGLGDDLWTDIYLAGVWVSALDGMQHLATEARDPALLHEVEALHTRAAQALERRFWLERGGIYAFALLRGEGADTAIRLNDALTVWPTTAMAFGQLQRDRAERMLTEVASAKLTTDWGTRPLSQEHPLYEPLHYNNGAVWPFVTGFAALAQYRYHRAWSGFELLRDVARTTFDFARGHNPELLSGAFYRPLDTAVPDQFFATSMLVTPLVRGLLGLDVNAAGCTARFAPALPPLWAFLDIRQASTGCGRLGASLTQTASGDRMLYRLILRHEMTGQRPLHLRVAPVLPVDAEVLGATVDRKAVEPTIARTLHDTEAGVELTLADSGTVEIAYRGGAFVAPNSPAPSVGDRSTQTRVLEFRPEGEGSRRQYRLTLESPTGTTDPACFVYRWQNAGQGSRYGPVCPAERRPVVGAPAGWGREELVYR